MQTYLQKRIIHSVAAFLPLLVAGCGSEEDSGAGDQRPEVIVPSTTKVLDEPSILALTTVDATSVLVTSPTDLLEGIAVGDVMAAAATAKTPYGLLRKVTDIEKDGQSIRFTTREAKLTEAIEKGKVSISATLKTSEVVSSTTSVFPGTLAMERIVQDAEPPVASTQAALEGSDGYYFGFDNVVLWDADDDATTIGDQVLLNGGISASASLTVEVDIDLFKVNTMALGAEFSESVNLVVTAPQSATLDEELEVQDYTFTPITFMVGPVPVVIVPKLIFAVGATGQVDTDFQTSVYESADASFLVGYIDGEFDASGDSGATFDFEEPTVCGNSSLKVYAGPRLELSLYGVVEAQLGTQGYLQLDADTSVDPWWNVRGGVEGYGSVGIGFFGAQVAEWDDTVGLYDHSIAEAPGAFANACSGDPFSIQSMWAYAYNDGSNNSPRKLIATADGGYLIVAGSSSVDTLLIKVDRDGAAIWQKRLKTVLVRTATQLTDQSYVLAGSAPGAMAWLGRVDSDGNLSWSYTVEADTLGADIYSIKQTFDGGYIVVGEVGGDEPTYAIWLARFHAELNPIWSKSFGLSDSDMDVGFQVEMTSDLGFVVLGRLGFATDQMATLFKVDADGEYLWGKFYNGTSTDALYSMISTPSGYAMAGQTQTTLFKGTDSEYTGFMAWVMQTDLNGQVLWSRAYGPDPDDSGTEFQLGAVDLAQNGHFYRIIGSVDELGAEPNVLAGSVDASDGSPYHMTAVGGVEAEEGVSVVTTYDGWFARLASAKSFNAAQKTDAWLFKTDIDLPFDSSSGAVASQVGGVFGDTDEISSGAIDLDQVAHSLIVSQDDVTVVDASISFTSQFDESQ